MSICFTVVYTYTAELYLTNIRVTSIGFFSAVCKLFASIMPVTCELFYCFGATGPFILFAILSLISSTSIYNM